MPSLNERLIDIREQIHQAAERVGRDPATVRLVAVSKAQSIEAMRAAIAGGQTCFGENYAHELRAKASALQGHPVEWHFVGHLQRNKVKDVVPHAAWIHTIDSVALAQAIAAKAVQLIHCCIEVNLAGESTKHGVAPEAIAPLAAAIAKLPVIRLEGLMCIPPAATDPEASRPYFRQLATLGRALHLQELSMGMTNDFQIAIEEGATMVRIGTAIFGERYP